MKDFKQINQIAQRLLGERRLRESRWRELSRWICPQRGMFAQERPMRERQAEILRFTQTGSQACLKGASGLTSGMTPRNEAWFRCDFRDSRMREAPGARVWLDSLDCLIRNCLASGGFYQAIHAFNMDLIWAGCALLYAEETSRADEGALRFECPQIGTWAIARDSQGRVSHALRQVRMSLEEMAAVFGEASLSRRSRRLLPEQPLQEQELWQLVLADGEGPLACDSFWWEPGAADFLHVGGYREMPFFFTCWHEGATVYGTGPGDEALPDARQLDILERHKLEGLAKIVNPPVAAPSHLKGHVSLAAGAVNYVMDRSLIAPIIDLGSFATSLPHLREEIATVTGRIQESLLAAIFNSMPLAARPAGMSATEFVERKREALQQIGPVISAYEPHVLIPVLFRAMQTLSHCGAVNRTPEALGNLPLELTLDFISPMANALRQSTAETTRALFHEVATMVQATGRPEILDKLDLDQMVDEYATGLGSPGSVVRADADVATIRQQRAQAQAQAEAMQTRALQTQQAQLEAQAMGARANAAQAMLAAGAQEDAAAASLSGADSPLEA